MSFFKRIKRDIAASRLNEEMLYEHVIKELAAGVRRDGLWLTPQVMRGQQKDSI